MTKGISVTSAIITISGSTPETVLNTFAEEQVQLNLDILSREVLLVYAIDLNPGSPDAQVGVNAAVNCSLSATSRDSVGRINSTNVLGAGEKVIRGGVVAFQDVSPETPTANALDYIGIISTNDFFVQIEGLNNLSTKGCEWRVWCARAKVTADIYAALVQGEALSA